MGLNVSIGEIHIDSVILSSEATSEVVEVLRGSDPDIAKDTGYTDAPEAPEAMEPPSEEDLADTYKPIRDRYDVDEATAMARRDFLRNVVYHVDKARKHEGLQTNHERRPNDPDKLKLERYLEEQLASESLAKACGNCALRPKCRFPEDIDTWIDVHPFKHDNPRRRFERRKGARDQGMTESRDALLDALTEDPRAHCDPAKRR